MAFLIKGYRHPPSQKSCRTSLLAGKQLFYRRFELNVILSGVWRHMSTSGMLYFFGASRSLFIRCVESETRIVSSLLTCFSARYVQKGAAFLYLFFLCRPFDRYKGRLPLNAWRLWRLSLSCWRCRLSFEHLVCCINELYFSRDSLSVLRPLLP